MFIGPNSMSMRSIVIVIVIVGMISHITSVAIRIMRYKEWGGTKDARSKDALQATQRSKRT